MGRGAGDGQHEVRTAVGEHEVRTDKLSAAISPPFGTAINAGVL
jgi:hypothetical protein